MEVNSHVLRLTGKAELPMPVEIGQNYHISLSGSITTQADSDNEDNTLTRLYTFKPIKVEVLTPLGKTIQAKDTRSNSQLIRSLLYKKWVNAASQESFDDFYGKVANTIMLHMDEIVDWAENA